MSYANSFALLSSFACLTYGFLTSDFTVKLVASHSHTDKPLLYKISALWGNHEGSMLLWVVMMSLYQSAFARWATYIHTQQKQYTLAIQAFCTSLFLAFFTFHFKSI